MTSSHAVVNPATEQVVADVPLTSAADTDEAIDRAHRAFPAMHGVKVLDPADPASEMGPLSSAAHRDRVASYVDGEVPVAFRGEYGLSGSIGTRDVGRALRVARGVQSGNLSVNSHSSVRYSTPFGGFQQSGVGRELGPDAVAAVTETKNVFISTE